MWTVSHPVNTYTRTIDKKLKTASSKVDQVPNIALRQEVSRDASNSIYLVAPQNHVLATWVFHRVSWCPDTCFEDRVAMIITIVSPLQLHPSQWTLSWELCIVWGTGGTLGGTFSFGVVLVTGTACWTQYSSSSTILMETISMVWWRSGSKVTGDPGDRSSMHWTV